MRVWGGRGRWQDRLVGKKPSNRSSLILSGADIADSALVSLRMLLSPEMRVFDYRLDPGIFPFPAEDRFGF